MFYDSWISTNTRYSASQCFAASSVWKTFQEARQKHNENICNETNKLVLRLDKLISAVDARNPNESVDSIDQSLEKSIVEWHDDELVNLCPYCAKAFTIARRRHHCRACGGILCNSCSRFLDFKSAAKLVRPAKLYTDRYDRIEDNLLYKNLESVPKIRLCEDCKRLLDKRIRSIEDHYSQPLFCDFYEKLRKQMIEADELILSYLNLLKKRKDISSLKELKAKIDKAKDGISLMGLQVSKMADREAGKQAYLLISIKQAVNYWLRENLDNKVDRIVGKRRGDGFVEGSAWIPTQPACGPSKLGENENPLLIQIKNLKAYIEQAKADNKYEEVEALEESKRDLEIEYLTQLQAVDISQ